MQYTLGQKAIANVIGKDGTETETKIRAHIDKVSLSQETVAKLEAMGVPVIKVPKAPAIETGKKGTDVSK